MPTPVTIWAATLMAKSLRVMSIVGSSGNKVSANSTLFAPSVVQPGRVSLTGITFSPPMGILKMSAKRRCDTQLLSGCKGRCWQPCTINKTCSRVVSPSVVNKLPLGNPRARYQHTSIFQVCRGWNKAVIGTGYLENLSFVAAGKRVVTRRVTYAC